MADDILKEALDVFEKAQTAETENRENARADIQFSRLSQQWPDQIWQQRQQERRPCLTINKLTGVIRQVVNDARMNRPATKVQPVDSGADKETAEVLSGLIRQIEVSSDADVAYDTAVECAVSGGFGYWRINTDYALNSFDEDSVKAAGQAIFDQNLFIRAVPNQFSIYGDPDSDKADSSDWMTAFVVDLMKEEQFEEKYPGAEKTDFKGIDWQGVNSPWRDGEIIQLAEYWKREKAIKKALMVQMPDMEDIPGDVVVMFADEFAKNKELVLSAGGQIISERAISTYAVKQYTLNGAEVLSTVDWPGAYIPIIPVYGDEVNLEGKRHFKSLIRDAKDAQQMFNYWRTSATEMVALAPKVPFIGKKGAFNVDTQKWSTANTHSHAYIEYDGDIKPERADFSNIPSGMLQEAMNAADDIKAITGLYDASLGARSNETSGVAINARAREGDMSTFHFIDNLSRAIRHSGRVLVDLIPKVYSTPRITRILGEDGDSDEVQLNQQFNDEKSGELRIHDVRTGRYDVVVTAGPGFTTRREEAASQMMELLRQFPESAPYIGDLLAKNLDWPGADEIAKRMERMLPPEVRDENGQIPPQVQQQMQQMQQMLQQMGEHIQLLQGQLTQEQQSKAIDMMKAETGQYDAETKRMSAVEGFMTPQQVEAVVVQTLQQLANPDIPATGTAPGMAG